MQRCTHVPQDASFAGCFAACLESFLIDNDKSPKTQKEMIELGKASGLCDQKGVVPDHNMKEFAGLFGIDLEKLENREIPAQETPEGKGILIGSWNYDNTGQPHCVRFREHVGKEKFRVMNPAPRPPRPEEDMFPEMTTKQIDEWKCDIFSIRLKDSPKPKR